MKLAAIPFIGLFLYTGFACPKALCQASFTDSTSVDSISLPPDNKSVKANQLFFDAEKAKMHNDSKKAAGLFEEFVTAVPASAAGYYQLSLIYDEDKKTEKAEADIVKAIGLAKDNKWYNEQYANILAKQGKYYEAAKVIASIADKETSDANYAMVASDYYERAQKYPEAITYIDKALTRSGQDEEILMHKVQIYLHMNEIEKAAGVIRELISQDSKNGKYYKLLGELYDNNKMPEKGLQVFVNAQKLLPGDPAVESGLSEHYLNLGDTVKFRLYAKQAILNNKLDISTQLELFGAYIQNMSDSAQVAEGMPLVAELLKQHPADATLMAFYGDFLVSDHQVEKAAAEYKKSLAVKPSNLEVWERLLGAYSDKDKADSLIKYSEKVIRLFPNQFRAHYFNAVGHYNKREYPQAIKAIKRSIDMVPETDLKTISEMYGFLGELYNSSKQFDESDRAFDKALLYQPDNATVLNNYSYFLSERNAKLDQAATMSEKSLRLRPDEATFLDTYGWILYKKGDYEKAKIFIERAVTLKDKNADATLYDHLGDVCYKLNDKAKAVQNWKIAKEKGSENPLLNKKISEEKLYE